MEKLYFNRLIRDKVVKKMEDKGLTFKVETLNKIDFERELIKKVSEEGTGLVAAKTREEFISEFSDLKFVIDEIIKVKNITDEELAQAQKINFEKKGGFEKKIYLHWTSDDGYKTNETTYDQANPKK